MMYVLLLFGFMFTILELEMNMFVCAINESENPKTLKPYGNPKTLIKVVLLTCTVQVIQITFFCLQGMFAHLSRTTIFTTPS
jgi:hypothetical protein